MQRHRQVEQGARIYNLFPLLAGTMDQWPRHMQRARDMGFNWIFVNPFHYPGFSGSLYAIKDYYRINPMLVNDRSRKPPMEQLRDVLQEGREMGLGLIMDLVINHTAVDSILVQRHPEWYLRKPDGSVVNPSAWEGDKLVTVWGDLAEIDNENASDRENLWSYWEQLTLHYRELGFDGFRCDAAYQVTDQLWKSLIHTVKSAFPHTLFFAETLGCEIEDVVKLAKSGFDYTFNSSKYWDFEEKWCLKQYRENAPWAPSVSFAESHDTVRLSKELKGDLAGIKQRYLFSALFSTGVMMPMGFEYGFQKRLNVVKTRPSDWEKGTLDLTLFIGDINLIKETHQVFNEDGPIDLIDVNNSRVVCLKKETFDGDECALIILNKNRRRPQTFVVPPFSSIRTGARSARVLTPDVTPRSIQEGSRSELQPSGFLVLHLQP